MTPERKQALQEHSQAVAKIARKCPSSPSPEAVPTSMDYCRFGGASSIGAKMYAKD
ncbi:hypothetical protein G7B40_040960 [Aetokthonos hydrillicola Thurmond2011]|jgi:hypothetical protein|uniref:Uncharacterized protein n=1 Tax=Aetokthonos hydrillicola Thurmond2011 TaxID=2712845 RepID=A0AAP5MD09_9CYAN|nr:hypothetical protein [Aetokthonos hydrillicola CCALA 1050]MBW4590854.1 hypothetical protein [Aetokthonos hydrillicola CCALA 1050]MDR9900860.1 hypothetical protein [Aetokthonos hydrillicola Thurmond2011]